MTHMRRSGCFVLLVAGCVAAIAQGNETVMVTQHARSLNGTVVGGYPHTLIAGVAVSECSKDFNDCLLVAKSDEKGRFTVRSRRSGRTHYLQFQLRGIDLEDETVVLSPSARRLRVILQVGN